MAPAAKGKSIRRTRAFGFTLVELVVVVTILSVLATIGFLALSWYSQDAKDSAIKANVRSLQSAITSEATIAGNSPRYYVIWDADYALSWASAYVDGTGYALIGWTWWTDSVNYAAGKPDYAKLKLNPEKFRISRSNAFDRAYGAFDQNAMMVGAADFQIRSEKSTRSISYIQTAAISPVTKIATVMGNFPSTSVPEGYSSGLLRQEPGSASNFTGALMDGQVGNGTKAETQNSTSLSISPAVSGKSVWDLAIDGPLQLSSTGRYDIVPQGSMSVRIKSWGAAWSSYIAGSSTYTCTTNAGGAGGYAGWTVQLLPGTYVAIVGEWGRRETEGMAFWWGGKCEKSWTSSQHPAGGGGLSWFFKDDYSQSNALIVAWGGGGAAWSAGGAAGWSGVTTGCTNWGSPGTLLAGWAHGTSSSSCAWYNGAGTFSDGDALLWGFSIGTYQSWGGGGGGYFWGWSGARNNYQWAGGGGGSNYSASSVISSFLENGSATVPGNASDPDRWTAWASSSWLSTASNWQVAVTACRGNDGKIIISLP